MVPPLCKQYASLVGSGAGSATFFRPGPGDGRGNLRGKGRGLIMKSSRRTTAFRRKLASLFFLAGFGVAGSTVQAQTLQELPAKTFMKQSVFYLPVKIEPRMRSSLREVRLYVKEGPDRAWELKDKASPGQQYFTFRAPRDGEYWFSVVTVDKTGRASPADIRNEAPGLIVVQDTQLPQVDVTNLGSTDEGTCLQCTVRDANPDLTKTHFYYQTGDQVWRSLSPMPNQMDRFCVPAQAVFTGLIRVEATDLAGNTSNREINVGTLPVTGANQVAAQPKAQMPPVMSASANGVPGQFPAGHVEHTVMTPSQPGTGPDLVPVDYHVATATRESRESGTPISKTVEMPEERHDAPSQPAGLAKSPSMTKHVVNKTHAFLQYQIENRGASGVGCVAIYLTRDQGQSWQKLAEDANHKSPAEIDLPGEGLFGLSVVVSNGRGFGGIPPAPGDRPAWWIEVDLTKPTAELTSVKPGSGADSGCVVISWNAHDKNMAGEAIDLYYAVAHDGPWEPIAKGLKNAGRHRWQVPANLGPEAFLRLVVHDAAGNTTISETTQGVTLDDLSRPRARVTSITTTPPQGGAAE